MLSNFKQTSSLRTYITNILDPVTENNMQCMEHRSKPWTTTEKKGDLCSGKTTVLPSNDVGWIPSSWHKANFFLTLIQQSLGLQPKSLSSLKITLLENLYRKASLSSDKNIFLEKLEPWLQLGHSVRRDSGDLACWSNSSYIPVGRAESSSHSIS